MNTPIIIAGPCAAESLQQMMETADGIAQCRAIHPNYTYIYRAGIWKPRTSPDTFQGIGSMGLNWLKKVQHDFCLDVATEVANSEQAELAMDAGIDYLWIGARTAANPIMVQTIADAITDKAKRIRHKIKALLIKNPVNEDTALWLGNIERLAQTGIPVMAVHRGCNHHPCWQMVYQLIQQRPDITLIMDPSHLSGRASAVSELCIKAQQLGYDGWMIETHVNPDMALSDAQQQISPMDLDRIISSVDQVSRECRESVELDWLRSMVDEVDDDLWNTIVKRLRICKQIGEWKSNKQMPVVQPKRFQEILSKRVAWGKEYGIDPVSIEQIMNAIHTESVRVQS